MGSYTEAFQACSSPPLSKNHSRWPRGKKTPALGPAARKAAPSRGKWIRLGAPAAHTNPTGKGLLGGAALSPTPPLGSRDQKVNADVPGGDSRCSFPLFAEASASRRLPRARNGQIPAGPRPGQAAPAAVWCPGSPLGCSGRAPRSPGNGAVVGAHRAWERCLWKALSRNAASFSQSS